MLRCVKWLPFACLGLFLLFGFIGYKLVKDNPVVPKSHVIIITFLAYDVDGNKIADAQAIPANGTPFVLPDHLQNAPDYKMRIDVKPKDASKYSVAHEPVIWRNVPAYRDW